MTRPAGAARRGQGHRPGDPRSVDRAGTVRPSGSGRLVPDRNQRELTPLAKRICARCPVRGQCLEYALSGADSWGGIATGIWSGTTPQERDRL